MPVGISELIVVFVIGLLILGPERLPRVATQIGRWVGKARRTANQLKYQLEREIALADLEEKNKHDRHKRDTKDDIAGPRDRDAAKDRDIAGDRGNTAEPADGSAGPAAAEAEPVPSAAAEAGEAADRGGAGQAPDDERSA